LHGFEGALIFVPGAASFILRGCEGALIFVPFTVLFFPFAVGFVLHGFEGALIFVPGAAGFILRGCEGALIFVPFTVLFFPFAVGFVLHGFEGALIFVPGAAGFILRCFEGALIFVPGAALFFPVTAQFFQHAVEPALGFAAIGEMLLRQPQDKLPDVSVLLQDSGQFLKNDGFNVFALQRHGSPVFSEMCHPWPGILAYPLVCCSVGREAGARDDFSHQDAPPPPSPRVGEGGRGMRGSGKPLRAIFRFRHQDAPPPPSPRVGEGGRGDEGRKRAGMQKTAHRVLPDVISGSAGNDQIQPGLWSNIRIGHFHTG
jgi:hypothetical protein